jgi:hypothetical protein
MNRRLIGYSIVVSLALTLLSIFFLDQPIAAFVQRQKRTPGRELSRRNIGN